MKFRSRENLGVIILLFKLGWISWNLWVSIGTSLFEISDRDDVDIEQRRTGDGITEVSSTGRSSSKETKGSCVVMHDAINFGVVAIERDAVVVKTIRAELIEAPRRRFSWSMRERVRSGTGYINNYLIVSYNILAKGLSCNEYFITK